MTRQQTLAESWKIRAFKIVFTFPEELFPDGAFEDQYQKVVWDYLEEIGMTSRLVNTEYGETGDNPHFDIVCTCSSSNTVRLDALKRKMYQITGYSQRQVQKMSDALKKHWIVMTEVKFQEDLENVTNYCIKEGRKKELKDGIFTDTFIQEAHRAGEARKKRMKIMDRIIVYDKTFIPKVYDYMMSQAGPKVTDLDSLICEMIRGPYEFYPVRAWRAHRAKWDAIVNNSTDYANSSWLKMIM